MNDILFAIGIASAIGLAVGLLLALASAIFYVPKDEMAERIEAALPGANCGACGFSGCSGYAKALAQGKAKVGLCSPGGKEVADNIAQMLGAEAENVEYKVALVHCMGSFDNTSNKMNYQGVRSCSAAMQLNGGVGSCYYGCMGFGDCANVCEHDAITVCNGVASIDPEKCVGCTKCVAACPKHLISCVSKKRQAVVRCSNCDKGADTRRVCKTGCIGCMRCVKACPKSAITINGFHAQVNADKCIGCGKCVDVCKQGCITFFDV